MLVECDDGVFSAPKVQEDSYRSKHSALTMDEPMLVECEDGIFLAFKV